MLLLHACVATRGIHHCFKSVVILYVWMPPHSPTMRMVRVKCHLASFWRTINNWYLRSWVCGIVLLIGITIVVESEFYELGD